MFSEMAGIVLLSTGVFRGSPNVCFLGDRMGGGRGEGPHGVFPCSSLSLWSICHLPLLPRGRGRGLLTLGPTLSGGMILGKCLRPCFLPGVHVIPRTHASRQWSPLASSLAPTSGRCHVKIDLLWTKFGRQSTQTNIFSFVVLFQGGIMSNSQLYKITEKCPRILMRSFGR